MGEETTNITFLGLVFIGAMGFLTLSLPRRHAVYPLLIATCYMPLGQMLVVVGLHFQVFRMLLVLGWCRVLLRREQVGFQYSSLDKLFLWWAAASLVAGTLAEPTSQRFVNRGGLVFNAVGTYGLIRCWLRKPEDVTDSVRFLAVMIVPLAAAMLFERATGRNLFYVFGGVPQYCEIRDGIRAQGAFRHPILAGTYGATLLPLFIGLWCFGRNSRQSVVGLASAVCIVVTSRSSGALLATGTVVLGYALWRMRWQMRTLRIAAVVTLLAFAVLMKAPVWFLIGRLSGIVGGTGWHRSYLIDQFIRHRGEWWLVGTTYTAHWAPGGQVLDSDPNNMDITNQYVKEGVDGGICKLGLFVAMIVVGFKTVGRAMRLGRGFPARIIIWSIGICLSAHCISFLSISYFDQIVVMWYWLLAILSMLALRCAVRRPGLSLARPKAQAEVIVAESHCPA